MPLPFLLLCLLLTQSLIPNPQSPAPPTEPRRLTPAQLEAEAIAAVKSNDLDRAESLFQQHAEQDPTSFTPWYNLAAISSLLADLPAAEQRFTRALALGFSDIRVVRADPHMAAFRTTQLFKDLNARWSEILTARRESDLNAARQLVGRVHESRTLDRWKIDLLSSHDPTATDEAAAEIQQLAAWITGAVFTNLQPEDAFEEDAWAAVVLPDREGFGRWTLATFGPGPGRGFSTIGGAYDHNRRRLVAQDLGATLRHELIHVLHWRDMSRLGQNHAAWIQEGLASLVEDYDIIDNTVTPVPSWRTNIVKRLHNARRLTPLDELAATSLDRLSTNRPLAQYAQSRAVMLFLLDQNKLTEFYRRYTQTFAADPTGMQALRETLNLPDQNAVEQAYQTWLTALPMVPETGSELPATLGIEIENGDGSGVRVTGLPAGARQRTGLSVGSFITAINNRPTRDLNELIRILADYAPGDTITLSHRRGRLHHTNQVTLLPR
jgi:hypothetical protein